MKAEETKTTYGAAPTAAAVAEAKRQEALLWASGYLFIKLLTPNPAWFAGWIMRN